MKKIFFGVVLSVFVFCQAWASQSQLEKALTFLNDGKTDEAMAIVKIELENNPRSSDNHMAMGFIWLDRGNYEEAKKSLQEALQIDRKIVAAHYMLAMIYEKEGDSQKAIDKWQRIIKHSKDAALRSLAEKHIKQLKDENND